MIHPFQCDFVTESVSLSC